MKKTGITTVRLPFEMSKFEKNRSSKSGARACAPQTDTQKAVIVNSKDTRDPYTTPKTLKQYTGPIIR